MRGGGRRDRPALCRGPGGLRFAGGRLGGPGWGGRRWESPPGPSGRGARLPLPAAPAPPGWQPRGGGGATPGPGALLAAGQGLPPAPLCRPLPRRCRSCCAASVSPRQPSRRARRGARRGGEGQRRRQAWGCGLAPRAGGTSPSLGRAFCSARWAARGPGRRAGRALALAAPPASLGREQNPGGSPRPPPPGAAPPAVRNLRPSWARPEPRHAALPRSAQVRWAQRALTARCTCPVPRSPCWDGEMLLRAHVPLPHLFWWEISIRGPAPCPPGPRL